MGIPCLMLYSLTPIHVIRFSAYYEANQIPWKKGQKPFTPQKSGKGEVNFEGMSTRTWEKLCRYRHMIQIIKTTVVV